MGLYGTLQELELTRGNFDCGIRPSTTAAPWALRILVDFGPYVNKIVADA
jgi:hypothetical protein